MQTANIDAHTGLIGLFGNPVGHSVSPAIHVSLAKVTGENLCYLAFPIEKEALSDAVRGGYALGAKGFNVTVPYKKDVMEYLVRVDEKASRIGAVNTLVRTEGGFVGYNTDMPGLKRAMEYDGVSIQDKSVVILGAGGVSNAVLCMALEYGAKQVLIVNRSLDKAVSLKERFLGFYQDAKIEAISLNDDVVSKMTEMDSGKFVAFQATNIGMHPKDEEVVIENPAFYEKLEAAYDMIFNPYETRFMTLAKNAGAKAYNGLRMLLFQGIMAYELWTDTKISDQDAEKILTILKGELGIHEA